MSSDRDSILIELATKHDVSLSVAAKIYTDWNKTHNKPTMSENLISWFLENPNANSDEIETRAANEGFSKASVRYYVSVLSLAKQISEQLITNKIKRLDN